MVVLVTGAGGQLGQAIRQIHANYPAAEFVFAASTDIDITQMDSVKKAFIIYKPSYCINAAAYTAVDKAESEPTLARLVNATGAAYLAEACKEQGTTLLHISTDFVFDGLKTTPYTEDDDTNPQGVYGLTKLEGEQIIQKILPEHYIIRTSWVYSQFGNNFYKTMLRLGQERSSLSVVNDQIGTPTHAIDLAEALMTIIQQDAEGEGQYGLYHFSNEGQCSWYDFAEKIFEKHKITIDLQPIVSRDYPTPAKRPIYSVLDKTLINFRFGLKINKWTDSFIHMNTTF